MEGDIQGCLISSVLTPETHKQAVSSIVNEHQIDMWSRNSFSVFHYHISLNLLKIYENPFFSLRFFKL